MWYSAIGSRNTATVPSIAAAATQVRSMRRRVVAAGRAGDDQTGDVAQHPDRVVVVEVPAESLLVREAGDPDDHRVAVRAVEKNCSDAASPRSWSSALCR